MKPSHSPRFSLCLVVAVALGLACSVTAASAQTTLTWDSDSNGANGATDGAGTWNTANLNWYNGTATDVVWSNGLNDTAIFGNGGTLANAAAGTVTVGTVNVGTISFGTTVTTGYTLSGGTITLGGAAAITTTNTLGSIINSTLTGSSGLAFSGVLNSQVGVTLGGANNYTGITTVSTGGRLGTNSATALGSNAGATASALGTNYTQVNANATVNVGVSTAEAFLINGQGSIASGNAPSALRIANGVTLSSFVQLGSSSLIGSNFGTVTLNGNLDVAGFTASFGNGNNPGTFTINGVVTGTAGGITINDGSGSANVVNLTNAGNTYVGTTTANSGGTLGLGGNAVLGGSTLALNSGTVRSTDGTARTIANAITVTANPIFGATTIQTGTLNFTYNTAAVTLGATTRSFTTNVDTTFAAAFSGTSQGISKAGAATLFLNNAASTYTGVTTVSAGTLSVTKLANGGANSSIGASTNAGGNLLINAGATLQYTGTGDSTDRRFTLNSSVAGSTGTLDASGTGAIAFTNTNTPLQNTSNITKTLILTGTNTGANTFAANLTDNGTGAVSLTKNGVGTWVLTGASTYTGGTTVSAGTLQANNGTIAPGTSSSTGIGAVTVSNTGTVLGGTGFINGTVTVNAGSTITGGTIGTISPLTLANTLTLVGASGSPATYLVDIGSGTNNSDRLTLTGAGAAGVLNLSGAFDQITFSGTPDGTSSYVLASYASVNGTFDLGAAPSGYDFQYNATELDLVPTAVPEPATCLGGVLLVGATAWSQRKRLGSRRAA